MNNKVSVIMPLFNGAKTINETVKSLFDQTFSNWELIIVDDCSKDNSYEIACSIADQTPNKIKVFKTALNGGPAVARNIATNHATGRFITFLDCDDIWLPDKLEKQLTFITSNNYSIIYSNYEKISYNGERSNRIVKMPEVVNYKTILKSNAIPCLTAMYDTDKLGKLFQIEDRFYMSNEDYIMWVQTLRKGILAHKLDEVLAFYRLSEQSISKNKVRMASIRWYIYRDIVGLNIFNTFYYYICYLFIGINKFFK